MAIMQEFGRLRSKEWSTGINGLMGCTALYSAGRRYMGHTGGRKSHLTPINNGRGPGMERYIYSSERSLIRCKMEGNGTTDLILSGLKVTTFGPTLSAQTRFSGKTVLNNSILVTREAKRF